LAAAALADLQSSRRRVSLIMPLAAVTIGVRAVTVKTLLPSG